MSKASPICIYLRWGSEKVQESVLEPVQALALVLGMVHLCNAVGRISHRNEKR